MLYKYKNLLTKINEEYEYGKKFSLDKPSMYDTFTDKLGKKILTQPKVVKSIVSGISAAIITNDNKKAFKSAVDTFKEDAMSNSKNYIMNKYLKEVGFVPLKPEGGTSIPVPGVVKNSVPKSEKSKETIERFKKQGSDQAKHDSKIFLAKNSELIKKLK